MLLKDLKVVIDTLEETKRFIDGAIEVLQKNIKTIEKDLDEKAPKELSPEEQEAFDELAKRCFVVISGKKPEETPVKTTDLSTEKEEPKEIVGKEEKQAHKYRYSAYRIKGDK